MHAPIIPHHVWSLRPGRISVTRYIEGPGSPGTSFLLWQLLEDRIFGTEDQEYLYVGMTNSETWVWELDCDDALGAKETEPA